ncbi:mucin-binding protein, partial [Levilactobacillus brevis]|uniref:mucin-binding protein n=1 Tax=Levilactobacillus brevis TaxID=1580 RepID=UPI001BB98B19|nr:hypothetical protein [Levilactobacillus brevis]
TGSADTSQSKTETGSADTSQSKTETGSADTSQSKTETGSADTSQSKTETSSTDTSQSETGTNLADTAQISSVTTGTSKQNSIGTRSSIDVQNAVSKVYNDVRKGLDANLASSVLLSVASDADSERESFNDIVNNGKNTSPTSVHVAVADQVANKDKYYAEAEANGTLAEVSTWDAFAKAYNTQSVTYIKLTKDISSGLSTANSNSNGTGNPLNQRTNGIIIDGDNNTLDLGLDVSMFVGTVPVGTQFTLTDVKLMQEHTQGSASSGSTRSVIQTPFDYRLTNDGLWTFNMNNIEYVGSATIDKAGNGKYGYTPARLVDMEDSLVNYSGNIKWYSDQELSTNGSVHIADGTTIQYAQTYNRSDMDSVFYFMSWDHANTVADTGAAHDIQIGDGSKLNFKATNNGVVQQRSVFYNSWSDLSVGDSVSWTQDGFTQLFDSYNDGPGGIWGLGMSYNGTNTSNGANQWFKANFGHDLDHRILKFGNNFTLTVPKVTHTAFNFNVGWNAYFAAATSLNVNQTDYTPAVDLSGGGNITFVSPKSLSMQIYNGLGGAAYPVIRASGKDTNPNGGLDPKVISNSSFNLNNSTVNYWNRVTTSGKITGTSTFQNLKVSDGLYSLTDYSGNVLSTNFNTNTTAFKTLSNAPGRIKIKYVDQNGNEVGNAEVTINSDNYIGQIINLQSPEYVNANMPTNYMWALERQVYSGAISDKQSGGDPTTTIDDGNSYGQATYAIVPAEEANRDNTYTIYVYGVPEDVDYQYIDARTGKIISTDSISTGQEAAGGLQPANFGNVIDWKNSYYTSANLPTGYHYAATTDELNGQVQPTTLTVGTDNPTTTIYIAGDAASAKVSFVDTQTGNDLSASNLTLTGYVGQPPVVGNSFLIPKNYKLDSNSQPYQSAFTSKLNGDGTTTVTYTKDLATSGNDIQINLVHNTTKTTETKVVQQVIKYVDVNGKSVSPDNVQKVSFTRSVTTDDIDHSVEYGDWTTSGETSFVAVTSPTISDMFSDTSVVPGKDGITLDTADTQITVRYYAKNQTVTPDDPKDPNTPVDPNNPDGPKWPDGVDKDSLNKTATRTIHYVDADGKQVA